MKRVTANTAAYSGVIPIMIWACNDWTEASLQKEHLAIFKDAEMRVIPDVGYDVIWGNPSASLDVTRDFPSTRNQK